MDGSGRNPNPADQTPPKEDLLGPEHLMPWEMGEPGSGGSDSQVAQGIYDLLQDDPEFADDEEGSGRPAPEKDEETSDVSEDEDDDFDELEDEVEDDEASEDESDDEEEAESDDEAREEFELDEELLLTVKIGGEEEEVTLREALDGYQRQADYTRKTQAIAAREKELATELEQTRQVRDALGQQLGILEQALSEEGTPPDWEKLREEDPSRFANEWAAYQLRQEKLRQLKQVQEQNAAAASEEQAKVLQQRLIEERNKLSELIPEFKDDVKAKAGLDEIRSYIATAYGATDQELNQIVDHRFVVMARKAMLYDRAKDKGGEKVRARTKGKRSGRVLSPGARPTESQPKGRKKGQQPSKARVKAFKRAHNRLRRTGRVEDAAAALLALEDE